MRGWLLSTLMLLAACASSPSWAVHGMGMGYAPKYGPAFTHFDYVNPDAPKGGSLTLSASGSFDKLNPFTLKGRPPVGMGYSSNGFVFAEYGLLFDSLMTHSEDEPFSNYGLLAEDVALAPDQLSVTFTLNPKARFSDGTPVLADDVKYSFDTLMSKRASPTFRSYWGDVKEAVVVGERTIRFDFKRRNAELHMIVGQLPVFSRAWGKGKPFDEIVSEAPIATGPYVIDKVDFGKSISYKLRPDYWAADLPSRKGMFNFGEVSYQYFKDRLGEEESLKTGGLDALEEGSISAWVRRYKGKRFDSGEILKDEISHRRFTGMQGIVMNLRQPRFQDVRVRQALALAFDFDWLNQHIFYGRRARTQSYFQNSDDLMAQPEVSVQEQALIDQLKSKQRYLAQVQGRLPRPASTGDTPTGLRRDLVQAQALLREAGWTYRDGALRNAAGQPFAMEIDIPDRSSEPVLAVWARNLGKLGITLQLRLRDPSLIKKKQDDFDFDLAVNILGGSSSPGNELYDDLGSASAAEKGSQNLSGISDPVIDEIIESIVNSHDRAALSAAARLLDRYLLHQHYVIPMYYGKQYFIARKGHLRRPEPALPQRLLAGSWLLTMWWDAPR
ncbi:extracellular solute-binding protein [Variovorax guangxiensis]|uniref:ABC transporter substrate-binding protein n=1 Tax=Variovorax guangxiensis TaxID=1775474 RepID=A0A502DZR3_9BURK|nr:extracellular solute-binding protein [Variovorax guangxiensis]TPG26857.1 ABC transporter substrate-binding protein [Variovorax ginsengisoli]TPG30584.1 ABC transporter substrate-binding protein [Variovorax guangxiensis]